MSLNCDWTQLVFKKPWVFVPKMSPCNLWSRSIFCWFTPFGPLANVFFYWNSFKKGNFCVLVKFMSGFETPGINSAIGLASVPEEKSSFSIVYSSFLYMNKFQIVQSGITFFSVVKGYHIITKHVRKGFGQRLPACNPCTCIQWWKQQKGWSGFLTPQISRLKGHFHVVFTLGMESQFLFCMVWNYQKLHFILCNLCVIFVKPKWEALCWRRAW